MTNFPDDMTRYDWDYVEGRHMRDNEERVRPSRTTGEPMWGARTAEDAADREWLRQLGLDVEAKTPAHRTFVISYDGMLFPMRCRTCGLIEGPKGASKEELEEFARAHEAEFASA